MTNIRNALMQAAGTAASGDPVYVEDVFSVDLSVGTGSNITVNNGIDLSGEGGLVIWRRRDSAENWSTQDTERGVNSVIYTDSSNAAADPGSYGLDSFNSNGFTAEANAMVNGGKFCSWTFRKQKGFFDVVTYTGDGNTSKTINHNLGCKPGMIIIKMLTESGYDWRVWHKSVASSNGSNYSLSLNNTTGAANGSSSPGGYWNFTAPTSTQFTVGNYGQVNNNGSSFVAYLFADGDESDAQIFGDDGDEAIIKTGSYQSTGNGDEVFVNLGFEPQWVMIKSSSDTQSWIIQDNMRGMAHSTSTNNYLLANSNGAENSEGTAGMVRAESNGMTIGVAGIINMFNSVQTYTYMAIRRGPMKEPDTNTDVLGITAATTTAPLWKTGNTVDLGFYKYTATSDVNLSARLLQGKQLKTNTTAATTSDGTFVFDYQTGFFNNTFNSSSYIGYGLRRYPKVFDVVVYEGTGSTRTVTHNLGVAPEMMIIKNIEQTYHLEVYHSEISPADGLYLSDIGSSSGASFAYASTQPPASVFTVGSGPGVNNTSKDHIALLFASLNGISKVGSYTGTGNDLNVTGLGAAARFVLIKRTDATGDWYVFDTTQGIASGNDPYWFMNGNTQVTGTDYIDPHSSGFTVTSSAPAGLNASGGTYIYLAFA